MSDPENTSRKGDSDSGTSATPGLSKMYQPTIRIVVSGRPDTVVRLEGVPDGWLKVLEGAEKKPSPWGSIFKDIVPGLTSLAAVLISLLL